MVKGFEVMEKVKFRISDLFSFESSHCAACLNDDGDDLHCTILTILGVEGSCDLVFKNIEGGTVCGMRRTDEEVSIENIIEWLGVSSTEEVGSVLEVIEKSYHYDVLKDGEV